MYRAAPSKRWRPGSRARPRPTPVTRWSSRTPPGCAVIWSRLLRRRSWSRRDTAAALAADLAAGLLALRRRIKDIDKAIETAFAGHPQAQVMRSLPGMGSLAAAEFTVAV